MGLSWSITRSTPIVLFSMLVGAAFAQGYPSKPIRIITPFPPGGTIDIMGRELAQRMTNTWQQPVLVDYKAGAGGTIAADAVAKAEPDGHTLLMAEDGLAISASMYRKLPYDPVRDLAPVIQLTSSIQLLVVTPGVSANSVKELVALATSQPGKLTFGSGGYGTLNHLYGELLKSVARVDILHVPYKGEAPRAAALMVGEVHMAFSPRSSVLPLLKAGKVRILAITGGRRSAALPDVPTMIESGVPEFDIGGWMGIFAPAGTPREIVLRLNSEAARILTLTDIKERLPSLGYESAGGTPDEFAERFRANVSRYARLIKDAKVPLVD